MAIPAALDISKIEVSKIFDSILQAIDDAKHIEEVDFVPDLSEYVSTSSGTDPVPFILENNKLGLSYWCTIELYKFSLGELKVCGARLKRDFTTEESERIIRATRVLLLVSADNYSAWNIRKRLLTTNRLSFGDDLALNTLVLYKHPKSGETWHHRMWLRQKFIAEHRNLQSEFQICRRVAEAYAKNYFAWSHRLWCLRHATYEQAKEELEFVRSWCSTHVSDHAAFHHRRSVLLHLSTLSTSKDDPQSSDVDSIYLEEFKLLSELITFYTGHEAMWHFRRGILYDYLSPLRLRTSTSENKHVERYESQRRASIGYLIWLYRMKGAAVDKLLRTMFVQRDLSSTLAMLKVLQKN